MQDFPSDFPSFLAVKDKGKVCNYSSFFDNVIAYWEFIAGGFLAMIFVPHCLSGLKECLKITQPFI